MDMSVKLNQSYPAPKPVTPVADKPSETPKVVKAEAPVAAKSQDSDNAKLKLAVQEIEKFVQSIKRNLEFSIDEHSGKVIVKEEGFWQRFLHNETAVALQKRLHFDGLTMVILPARVY